jgi:hypothetical protein
MAAEQRPAALPRPPVSLPQRNKLSQVAEIVNWAA